MVSLDNMTLLFENKKKSGRSKIFFANYLLQFVWNFFFFLYVIIFVLFSLFFSKLLLFLRKVTKESNSRTENANQVTSIKFSTFLASALPRKSLAFVKITSHHPKAISNFFVKSISLNRTSSSRSEPQNACIQASSCTFLKDAFTEKNKKIKY